MSTTTQIQATRYSQNTDGWILLCASVVGFAKRERGGFPFGSHLAVVISSCHSKTIFLP